MVPDAYTAMLVGLVVILMAIWTALVLVGVAASATSRIGR